MQRPPVARRRPHRRSACRSRPTGRAPLPCDQIGRADEVGDEAAVRTVVDVLRRADLLDPAAIHHDHPVGDRQRLLLVVRDIERGDVRAAAAARAAPPASRRAAWRRGWTAARRTARRSARTRSPAPPRRAAAGRPTASMPDGRRNRCICTRSSTRSTFCRDLGLRQLAHAQAVGDVVEHRHVRPDRVGLEHHRHAALLGRHVAPLAGGIHRLAVQADDAAARLSPARRPRATSWSCRSRRGRAASPARRARCRS